MRHFVQLIIVIFATILTDTPDVIECKADDRISNSFPEDLHYFLCVTESD